MNEVIDEFDEIDLIPKDTVLVVLQNGLDTARAFIHQYPENAIIPQIPKKDAADK